MKINPNMVDIYCPGWSKGLSRSGTLLAKAIKQISGGQVNARLFWLRMNFYDSNSEQDAPPPALTELGSTAIMVERMFSRPFLSSYQERVLMPNPEWLEPHQIDAKKSLVDAVLHKTHFSVQCLKPHFPDAEHHYLGFTSPDPRKTVQGHTKFSHFRGKATTRHTQSLIDIWQRRPDLPMLRLQAYGSDISLRLGRWLTEGNISFMLDFNASDDEFFTDLAVGGIHLCTSGTEGFGHYINESRAMAALVLTLDAPPMNELITPDTGILIPTTSSTPLLAGVNFTSTANQIEGAIDKALSLSPGDRQELGQAARRAYEADIQAFVTNVRAFLANRNLPH